ncbi:hypothetical protein FOZ62_017931, partial [Perkinsus olseni]
DNAPGFADIKDMIMGVCNSSSMGVSKKSEVRDLLESLHNLYTGAQEGLVKAQSRLINLLEDHSALKDELSKAKIAPPASADGRLGIRVSDAERARADDAAKNLGYHTKVLGSTDPNSSSGRSVRSTR